MAIHPFFEPMIAVARGQAEAAAANGESERMRKTVAKMKAALEQCEEYLDQRADADLPSGALGYIPNEEMSLLTEVREALGKGGY